MLSTIYNDLQTKSFVKSEKYYYKFASVSDVIQIHNLEKRFCKENKIPPETIKGTELFLYIGGKILVQSYQEKFIGAFWIISIKDMLLSRNEIIKVLPDNSPLKKLYLKDILQRFELENFLIYSWTHSIGGKWFYRLILKWITFFYKDKKLLYGFVLKENTTAVYYYLKMGCKIIDELSSLYSTDDAHYILMYQTCQSKSLRLFFDRETGRYLADFKKKE